MVPEEQYSTLCVIATGICGILLLFTLSKTRKSEESKLPISIFRLSLAIIITGLFILGLTVFDWWFSIEPLMPLTESIIRIILCAIINFVILTVLIQRLQEK